MKKIVSVLIVILISVTTNSQSCDLQAVSVSPTMITPKVGNSFEIELVMKNNGPDVLPAKEATAHITINNNYLVVPTPKYLNFRGDGWKLDKIKRSYKYGYADVFISSKEDIPPGKSCFIRLTVRAKAEGQMSVSVVSSLSGKAKSSDPDGSNQSTHMDLIIIR